MSSSGNKKQPRAWRARHREFARAALPLPDDEMEAVGLYSRTPLPTEGRR